MHTTRFIVIICLWIFSLTMVWLSIISFNKWKISGNSAIYLSLCMSSVSIYTLGYAMELSSNTLEGIMFWVRFEHIGIQMIAPFLFLFTLHHTYNEKLIPKKRFLIFIIPVMNIIFAMTLGKQNILHANPYFVWVGQFPIFHYHQTIWMKLALVYLYLLLIGSAFLIIRMMFGSTPVLRRQSIVFMIAILIPFISGLVYNSGNSPYNLDLTPFSFSISSLLMSYGFLKLNILTIVPMARNLIFEGMRDGVLVLNGDGTIIDLNSQIIEIFPTLKKKTIIGKSAISTFEDNPQMKLILGNINQDNTEISVVREKETEYYQVRKSILKNSKDESVGVIIKFTIYTEVKNLHKALEELADTDELTGICNRSSFLQNAEKEILRIKRYGGNFSLIIFDLDHFKKINDQFGHVNGDIVLRRVVNECQKTLRKNDFFGRFGGEEFIFLLPETNLKNGYFMAERIRKAIEKINFCEIQTGLHVTASFGVVSNENQISENLEDILRSADLALYQAKEAGRNCTRIFQEMNGIAAIRNLD
ncbi:histidine kinase N-terminal 7TM domain-containing diguanylate cyclase [Flexilinea flocculi]|uniref:Protein containing diguanylate cyclase (GGDEF) domain n=1 Tax=Flexilinea flocculi TaxID=1678840 RepID=A0A0S7BKK0_9CHLR|nr:diguanylate cyclase [Flexilinea flocculi]NMB92749.1 diguanylate cyclase [Flexilinea flocculi]GAP40842.1 protein containing diguanylate cyclase (GGDEF) domain [Flexilinea flocculi]